MAAEIEAHSSFELRVSDRFGQSLPASHCLSSLANICRRMSSDLNRRLLAFLPISFLFFSLTYWENLNWTTTGLINIPVIFFSLLAIYLLLPRKMIEPTRARLLLACLAAALAAFTSANGFLLGPVGLLILLARRAYARASGVVRQLRPAARRLPLPLHSPGSPGGHRFLRHQTALLSCLFGLWCDPVPLAGRAVGHCDPAHPLACASHSLRSDQSSCLLLHGVDCGDGDSWSRGCGERSVSRSGDGTASIPFWC